MKLRAAVCTFLALLTVFSGKTIAGETGHYVNGVEGIRSGTVPPPGLYYRFYSVFYRSDDLIDRHGDRIDNSFDLSVFSKVHRLIWVTNKKILGGDYFVHAVMPIVYTDFEINAAGVKDNDFGLGDVDFSPLSIAWHRDGYDLAVGLDFFAPTGKYNKLNPASPGKDFWTTMFTAGATYYLDEKKTWSAAILARYETHSNKDHTDVTPGDNFHFEWGIGKTIDETLEAGPAGYSQWQVTDDSGSDVAWSKSIHDQVHAIGPEVNLTIPSKSMFLTFRYLWEFHAVDSPEGQLMALTLTKRF
ncbi:MAG: SphA family protein [Planctomycetota bacterium]|jgi:hypothetical protein